MGDNLLIYDECGSPQLCDVGNFGINQSDQKEYKKLYSYQSAFVELKSVDNNCKEYLSNFFSSNRSNIKRLTKMMNRRKTVSKFVYINGFKDLNDNTELECLGLLHIYGLTKNEVEFLYSTQIQTLPALQFYTNSWLSLNIYYILYICRLLKGDRYLGKELYFFMKNEDPATANGCC